MGQGGACGDAGAGDHVEHPTRVAGFEHQFCQFQRRQWGFVGGLEHHGAARGQRRTEFPAGQQQRKVPGDDGADHTHCFSADKAVELIVRHQR
ncbi:hypothetical protein D3C78_885130 [compost metagenome]